MSKVMNGSATPNGTSRMCEARVKAISSRAGRSWAGVLFARRAAVLSMCASMVCPAGGRGGRRICVGHGEGAFATRAGGEGDGPAEHRSQPAAEAGEEGQVDEEPG